MSDEETQGLLRNTQKCSKGHKFMIVTAAALVFTAFGLVVSLLRNDALLSGTRQKRLYK
jgi:hypothetical protein